MLQPDYRSGGTGELGGPEKMKMPAGIKVPETRSIDWTNDGGLQALIAAQVCTKPGQPLPDGRLYNLSATNSEQLKLKGFAFDRGSTRAALGTGPVPFDSRSMKLEVLTGGKRRAIGKNVKEFSVRP